MAKNPRQYILTQMTGPSGRRRRTAPSPGENRPPRAKVSLPPVRGRVFLGMQRLGVVDRHVLYAFIRNWVLSFVVLMGLYMVLDMVVNFDEFTEPTVSEGTTAARNGLQVLWGIVDYYFFQSFRIFSYMSGLISVVATAFTLMRMSRFNETVALLAAGVPLLRVAAPIVFASLVLNAMLVVNQELIVPNIIAQLTRERGAEDGLGAGEPLQSVFDGRSDLLFAGSYLPPRPDRVASMQELTVIRRLAEGVSLITADRATWDSDIAAWQLENGFVTRMDSAAGAGEQQRPIFVYQTTISPDIIALKVSQNSFVDLLSRQRINELLSMENAVGQIDLLRVREARLANYLINVVLVLLTIPCVLTREPRILQKSSLLVFIAVGSCLATVFISQNMAGLPPADPSLAVKWPALMSWLPVFVFGGIAVAMLDRIRT